MSNETKFSIVIFTCARDFERAKRAANTARDNWGKTGSKMPRFVFAVHASESALAREALPGEELFFHNFNAGGSLRYSEAIHGMRSIYRQVFRDECDAILKLDSDTLLYRPQCFTDPVLSSGVGFVAVRRYAVDSTTLGTAPKDKPILNLCNGCAYMMTKEAFGYIDGAHPSLIDAAIHEANGHEDLFFSRMFSACDAVFCSHISKQLCVFDGDESKVDEKTVYLQLKKEGEK